MRTQSPVPFWREKRGSRPLRGLANKYMVITRNANTEPSAILAGKTWQPSTPRFSKQVYGDNKKLSSTKTGKLELLSS